MWCEFCEEEVGEGALACPRCGSPVSRSPEAGSPDGSTSARRSEATRQEPPLARVEEDVFALAEETVIVTDEGELAVAEAPAPTDAGTIADAEVPPGTSVAPEAVAIDTTFTGGYKGPAGPSVAGAGVQTQDDPFGLNITEAPPSAAGQERRGLDMTKTWNIVAMVLIFLLVCTIVIAGIYFGFLRKDSGGQSGEPAETVKEFFTLAIEGDTAGAAALAAAGSTIPDQVQQLLIPYRRQGSVTLKDFKSKITGSGGDKSSVEITGLDVDVMTDEGTVTYNLLEHTRPFPLPTTIELESRSGQLLITN